MAPASGTIGGVPRRPGPLAAASAVVVDAHVVRIGGEQRGPLGAVLDLRRPDPIEHVGARLDHRLDRLDLGLRHQRLDRLVLVARCEGHDRALGAGARGASGAVEERLRVGRGIHVDHEPDVVDVNPPGGDVGRHQHGDLALRERGEVLLARPLAQVAVEGGGRDPGVRELGRELLGERLGAHEEQRASGVGNELGEDLALVLVRDEEEVVGDARVGALRVDRVGQRIVQEPVDQHADVAVEGRREEQALAGGNLLQQALHRRQEAHVGHEVGFVHDDHLDVGERERLLLQEVLEPAGRGDHDVDAALEPSELAGVADAAVHGHGLDAHGLAERLDGLGHLDRQLARGHQHQRTGTPGTTLTLGQPRHDRQREGDGLAGAGPAAAQDIASGQSVGQRGGLDGEGGLDAALGEGPDKVTGHAEFGEGGQGRRAHDILGWELRRPARVSTSADWPTRQYTPLPDAPATLDVRPHRHRSALGRFWLPPTLRSTV